VQTLQQETGNPEEQGKLQHGRCAVTLPCACSLSYTRCKSGNTLNPLEMSSTTRAQVRGPAGTSARITTYFEVRYDLSSQAGHCKLLLNTPHNLSTTATNKQLGGPHIPPIPQLAPPTTHFFFVTMRRTRHFTTGRVLSNDEGSSKYNPQCTTSTRSPSLIWPCLRAPGLSTSTHRSGW
jgi:hypothetical protein